MEKPGLIARIWQPLKRRLWPVFALAAVLWLVLALETVLPGTWTLRRFGIVPRDVAGLSGIATAPFVHEGLRHLLANTLPLLGLGSLVAMSGRMLFVRVAAASALFAGAGTWVFGTADRMHIGASGMILGLLGFLLARGWIARRIHWTLISLAVGVVYLGTVAGMVLPERGVSWSGHFWGLVGGIVCAWWMYRRIPDPPTLTLPALNASPDRPVRLRAVPPPRKARAKAR